MNGTATERRGCNRKRCPSTHRLVDVGCISYARRWGGMPTLLFGWACERVLRPACPGNGWLGTLPCHFLRPYLGAVFLGKAETRRRPCTRAYARPNEAAAQQAEIRSLVQIRSPRPEPREGRSASASNDFLFSTQRLTSLRARFEVKHSMISRRTADFEPRGRSTTVWLKSNAARAERERTRPEPARIERDRADAERQKAAQQQAAQQQADRQRTEAERARSQARKENEGRRRAEARPIGR